VLAIVVIAGHCICVIKYVLDNQSLEHQLRQTIPNSNFIEEVIIETNKSRVREIRNNKTAIKNNSSEKYICLSLS